MPVRDPAYRVRPVSKTKQSRTNTKQKPRIQPGLVTHVCTTALRELTSEDGELTANTDHIGRKDQRPRGEIRQHFSSSTA